MGKVCFGAKPGKVSGNENFSAVNAALRMKFTYNRSEVKRINESPDISCYRD